MITTCTNCGECYEAWSEEVANHPTRYCPECKPTMGDILHVEDAAECAADRGDMDELDRLMAKRRRMLEARRVNHSR